MRYKLLAALVFISCGLQAQQVNPVPDYVFQNRMSVGRTTVTDTLAYFSMGPRYGAIRGFMPPMVVDTALVTGGTKRNGLTIFSIQKNKYVYWDSVGSKWAEMAGTGGSAINSGDTASMLLPYVRGSGIRNYVPKFTATRSIGTSLIYDSATFVGISTTTPSYGLDVNGTLRSTSNTYLATSGSQEVYIRTTTDAGAYVLQIDGALYNTSDVVLAASSGNVGIGTTSAQGILQVAGPGTPEIFFSHSNNVPGNEVTIWMGSNSATNNKKSTYIKSIKGSGNDNYDLAFGTANVTTAAERMRILKTGEVGIGTTSPTEKLEVNGNIKTAAPTSGSAKPWRLGEAATVSPTSPNRTIRVEIDGTVYYIHAKTTND